MKRNRRASSEILWRLATNVKRLRKARGYSQKQLQRRCGFPQGYVSKIEAELLNVSVANLEALCNGLDCALYDLFAPVRAQPDQGDEP